MRLRQAFLRSVEAGIVGLFFIQSIRYLYSTLYAHISSADLVRRLVDSTHLLNEPGYIKPQTVENEIAAIGIALLTPLLGLVLAHTRWSIPLAVAVCVVARSVALLDIDSAAIAAAVVVGASLFYLVTLIIWRPEHFPSMFLIGITLDMLIRATGNTLDPTWDPDHQFTLFNQQIEIETLFFLIGFITLTISGNVVLLELEVSRLIETPDPPGILTGWGSLALGSFLFLELSLLGLANAVARWVDLSYAATLPWLVLATTLPLVPAVRDQLRVFLGAFDGVWRGWLWALLLGLLLVLGNRFDGVLALAVMVVAQFIASSTLWWMVKRREGDSTLANPTPVLVLVAAAIFTAFSIGDYFTYDYAFVRNIEEPFTAFEDVLRSMRDFGLQLFLVASLILCMPIILERRVIPWRGGRRVETYLTMLLVLAVSLGSIQLSMPPAIKGPANINCLRVATLNLHSGYTLLFEPNLERTATAMQRTGADIILLQEVDTGRNSSFGVDQVEWLARELEMEAAYFPQNEKLQGLAVLSRIPISEIEGQELTSESQQAVMMRVNLALDESPFYIYNVWLGFQAIDENGVPLPLEQQDQYIQTRELRQILADEHGASDFTDRIILGGTFNYDRDTVLYNEWDQSTFVDPLRDLAKERIKTIFLIDNTTARYDYLWVMNLPADQALVALDEEFVVSDHRITVIRVSPTPGQQCP